MGAYKDIQFCVSFGSRVTEATQQYIVSSNYPTLIEENFINLKKQQVARQPLFTNCIQPFNKAIIQKRVLALLKVPHCSPFIVSIRWTRRFLKRELNWLYQASTTT